MSATISRLTAAQVAELWLVDLEPLLAPAIARTSGRIVMEDVLARIAQGRFGCWVAQDGKRVLGVAVCELVQYARKLALNVVFIAGVKRATWAEPMGEALEAFARANALDLIEGLGRKGFERVLPGFKVSAFAYEKELR